MIQKIILQLEIDDSQLDAAQAKLDKFLATLNSIHNEVIHLQATHDIDLGKLLKEGEFLAAD